MVWGSFGRNKVRDLAKIDGKMNEKDYHAILQRHAKTSGLRLIGKGIVLQQDKDSKHTSRLSQNYVKSLEVRKISKNMEWPPQSSDCNPIELLWDELDRRIQKREIMSGTQLWEVLQQEWRLIPTETLAKLTQRMPRVCKAVMKAKGGWFEESKI